MWGSALLGDVYDTPITIDDEMTKNVITSLSQHPNFEQEKLPLEIKPTSLRTSSVFKSYSFPINGDGWIESSMGKTANEIIRSLKKARRDNKIQKEEIDLLIDDIRMLKSIETDITIKSLSWSDDFHDTIKHLGLSDRKLKALRKFGETRSSSLIQACELYKGADISLKILDEHEEGWGEEEQLAWASAMKNRTDAKKMWTSTLHQIDKLSKSDKKVINFAAERLQSDGPLNSRVILERAIEKGIAKKTLTPQRLGSWLSMYGEEVDIYKGARKGTFIKMDNSGFIIKDVWSYAAGFLDADGSIFITERGEPRASFIATGSRGRAHCEQMHKALDCGILALDQRISKNSNRTTHRLLFNSKADLRKLLKGVLPHLKMKDLQAKAVLTFIEEKNKLRKQELQRLVSYENWKDDTLKAKNMLDKWGLNVETVVKYGEGL